MDRKILKSEFSKSYLGIEIDYDYIAMTWGVSHFRFVRADKMKFSTIEQFFKEVMLSPNSLEGSVGEILPWAKRANLNEYVDGLEISDYTSEALSEIYKSSIIEAKKYKSEWSEYQDVNLDSIDIPVDNQYVISIKESSFCRFHINTYEGLLSQSNGKYYFYESQFES